MSDTYGAVIYLASVDEAAVDRVIEDVRSIAAEWVTANGLKACGPIQIIRDIHPSEYIWQLTGPKEAGDAEREIWGWKVEAEPVVAA